MRSSTSASLVARRLSAAEQTDRMRLTLSEAIGMMGVQVTRAQKVEKGKVERVGWSARARRRAEENGC